MHACIRLQGCVLVDPVGLVHLFSTSKQNDRETPAPKSNLLKLMVFPCKVLRLELWKRWPAPSPAFPFPASFFPQGSASKERFHCRLWAKCFSPAALWSNRCHSRSAELSWCPPDSSSWNAHRCSLLAHTLRMPLIFLTHANTDTQTHTHINTYVCTDEHTVDTICLTAYRGSGPSAHLNQLLNQCLGVHTHTHQVGGRHSSKTIQQLISFYHSTKSFLLLLTAHLPCHRPRGATQSQMREDNILRGANATSVPVCCVNFSSNWKTDTESTHIKFGHYNNASRNWNIRQQS